ncbi:hydro-lyase, Fe-S type, tartrate/fumarate subfamily, alpha subunit [Ammonifex degensii KC4]|uniref:Hydro-lyase, Fe-S type, tartrate/fumarate subfamily, alpha subunit n=1 Tax=Ammonifex degensii (strain DSM 10501 / KC4) TaxID=429009 RepID=C9RB37_AMMDK|nr:fumarate hydratase [Ammonifex degensii]ACX51464.1 hydro-lyase, Fe-S type, tartrate/fumarate subfamily, alpha subunit [Ammonifex degensii KC4]
MREITAAEVTATVARLFREANLYLPPDVKEALKRARERESSPRAREILSRLLENALIAEKEGLPICQDTGIAVVFLEMGQEVRVVGELEEAVHEGIRQGFREGYLRASVVRHPLDRVNTGDSAPAVIHTRLVPGDRLKITVMPKGAGSENMGVVKVLRPADGREGVKRLVLETVQRAGPNACPPLVVGVGIGGTVEKAALLAKKAVLRPVGSRHPDPLEAELEEELLEAINCLGMGPLGLGGDTTALAVHVATYPCHIASLPVAVNLSCHATRHRTAIL